MQNEAKARPNGFKYVAVAAPVFEVKSTKDELEQHTYFEASICPISDVAFISLLAGIIITIWSWRNKSRPLTENTSPWSIIF